MTPTVANENLIRSLFFLTGGPGSGKGTQSLKIAERYGFDLIVKTTSLHNHMCILMQIPDEEGIVIDGFPRDVAQALSFEDQVSCLFFWLSKKANPSKVIHPVFTWGSRVHKIDLQ
uniref:Adenylate kinase n=1 Tax=Laticauda laticaudata TaxID=8630 RepID=A0A8C5SY11_LATLA